MKTENTNISHAAYTQCIAIDEPMKKKKYDWMRWRQRHLKHETNNSSHPTIIEKIDDEEKISVYVSWWTQLSAAAPT